MFYSDQVPFWKTIQRMWVLYLFLCSTISVVAQPAENSRLQRDTEVLHNLLNEFFKASNPDTRMYAVHTQSSDVKYFPGFGLLIESPTFHPIMQDVHVRRVYIYNGSTGYNLSSDKEEDEDDEDDEDEEDTPKPVAVKVMANDSIIQVMKSFAASYGNLMNFLQPNEKIFFYYDKKTVVRTADKKNKSSQERIMLEWNQPDTRLNGPEMAAKAKVAVMPVEKLSKPEFDIMEKIFYSSFPRSSSDPFSVSSSPIVFFDGLQPGGQNRYEVFKGLGIIYHFSVNYNRSVYARIGSYGGVYAPGVTVFSNQNEHNVVVSGQNWGVATTDDADNAHSKADKEKAGKTAKASKDKTDKDNADKEKDKTKDKARAPEKKSEDELQKDAQADYAAFLTKVKEYMIEYGRTLRSLDASERIIVEVDLHAIRVSSLPGKVELSVLKAVLDEYDKQSLSLPDAVSRITIREYPQAAPTTRSFSTTRSYSSKSR